MLESHLSEGQQKWDPAARPAPERSITDACIGWQETETLLREAAEAVSSESVEVVIVDGGTSPKADFKMVALLKGKRPDLPIVYLSEGGNDELAIEAFRSGARDYYRKPVNLFDLRQNLTRLAALRRISGGSRRPYLQSAAAAALSPATSNLPTSLLRTVAHMEDNLDGDLPWHSSTSGPA